MSEELLVRHCAPTLAGMKTGNLFTCAYSSESDLRETVRRWNQTLSAKGIRVLPLRHGGSKALIYLYRPSHLRRDLMRESACSLLHSFGYAVRTPEHCLVQLIRRLGDEGEFPHEIGLFLGYPPEDVSGFIENRAADSKCVGCWKVYGDEEAAKKTFEKYKKCTRVYRAQYARGTSIERLTVAG